MNTDASPPPTNPADEPLLTGGFSGPVALFWLWLLPGLVLLGLNLQGYLLIEGNMGEAQRAAALRLGVANLLNIVLAAVAWLFALRSPRSIFRSLKAASGLVGFQIAYLWLATAGAGDILPASVTAWIYPWGRYFFNQYALSMLPLAWAILRIASSDSRFMPRGLAVNWGLVVGMPLGLFVVVKLMDATGSHHLIDWLGPFVVILLLVAMSSVLFIAIIRATLLSLARMRRFGRAGELAAIVALALAMPLGGLLLNRSIPFPVDFQAWEVYALTIANAAVLAIASLAATRRPGLAFCLLCSSGTFTLYFFFVFLPYTPLSIFAVALFGTGFLVLTPTFLFALHLHLALRAWRHRRRGWPLALAGFACFLVLPALFGARALADRAALNGAIDYAFTPGFDGSGQRFNGNRTNLRRALRSHRHHKNGIYYPFLSDTYSWIVFNNLVLPDDKIEILEDRFFGSRGSSENLDPLRTGMGDIWGGWSSVRGRTSMPRAAPPSREVEVAGQDLRLVAAGPGTTQATLLLTLATKQPSGEYINRLQVPPGVVVNGFRLHINGTPVPGRIFEKKTALWVYTMIRDTERRDPGLLVYNHPDEIELRVFPVVEGTPSTVEIDFLLPASVEAVSEPVPLPDPSTLLPSLCPPGTRLVRADGFTYLAPLETATLPPVSRGRYLHFIIDRSADNALVENIGAAIARTCEAFPEIENGRITLANYEVAAFNESLVPVSELTAVDDGALDALLPVRGGFDPDRALSQLLADYCRNALDHAGDTPPPEPLFVVLGEDPFRPAEHPLERARIWESNLSTLDTLSACRSNGFSPPGAGAAASATPVPLVRVGDALRPVRPGRPVIFPSAAERPEYFDPDTRTWLALETSGYPADGPWGRAMALWVANHDHAASPGSNPGGLAEIVGRSRETGILVPATSYIVVENEAQWRMLERKENQKLDENEALDFLETPAPPALVVGLLFAGYLLLRNRPIGLRASAPPR